jgi:hypothetical protein
MRPLLAILVAAYVRDGRARNEALLQPTLPPRQEEVSFRSHGHSELKFAVETGELGPEALRPVPTLAIRPGHILLGGLSRQSRWLAVTGPNHTWVWWIERIVVGYGTLLLLASAAWMMCRGSGATAVSNHDHAQTGYVSRPLGEIARTMWIGLALLTQVMLTILIVRYYMTMDDAGIYPIYASILYPSGVYFILLLQLPQTRHWFLSPGNLATATHILLETLDAEAKENTSWFRKNQTIAQVFTDTDPASGKTKRWFQYLCVRYVWSEQEQMFLPAGKAHFDGPIPTTGLDSKTVQDLVTESPNVIDVAVPSVLQALAIEFSGAFYVFQLMACCSPSSGRRGMKGWSSCSWDLQPGSSTVSSSSAPSRSKCRRWPVLTNL